MKLTLILLYHNIYKLKAQKPVKHKCVKINAATVKYALFSIYFAYICAVF